MTQTVPLRFNDFVSSIGVNTHIPYTDGGYANLSNVVADLAYLGINQVRDGISDGANGSAPVSSFVTLAKAGVDFTFGAQASSSSELDWRLSLIAQVEAAVPGSISAVEGANEVNNWPVTYNGISGLDGAVALQQDIYAKVRASSLLSGVAVDYFTGYDAGNVGTGPNPSLTPGLADFDNQHPYPLNGDAPGSWISRARALTNDATGVAPAVYTETGYSSDPTRFGGVDATVQAKYTLDLLLDAAAGVISRTYLYELMDAYAPGSPQGDDGFGLFDSTGAPKPVAIAIHNLTTLLQDQGSTAATFQSTPFSYTLTGLPAAASTLALQRSDGTTILAVWAEPKLWDSTTGSEIPAAASTATLTLPAAYASAQVFDPLSGTSAIATYGNTSQLSFSLSDHPILIELSPATVPVTTSKAVTQKIVVNLSEDAYLGNAQFTIAVDGQQIGGVRSATASHAAGKTQAFALTGNFGSGGHIVTVNFLNDAYGNAASKDRNLYVDSITYGGTTTVENAGLFSNGPANFYLGAVTAPTVVITAETLTQDTGASASDLITKNGLVTLTGTVTGAAGTTVKVLDGSVVLGAAKVVAGGTWSYVTRLSAGTHSLAAVASDTYGQSTTSVSAPTVTVTTALPAVQIGSATPTAGSQTLSGTVSAPGGTVVQIYNRTVLLGSATLDGQGGWTFTSNLAAGAYSLSAIATDLAGNRATAAVPLTVPKAAATVRTLISAPAAAAASTITTASPAVSTQLLTVNVSEDAYLGDAQFVLTVDGQQIGGVQTVSASHALDASQTFAFAAGLTPGTHAIGIDFLNDLYGGAAGDRNLYVNSIGIGSKISTTNAAQWSSGVATYGVDAQANTSATNGSSLSVASGTTLVADAARSATGNIAFQGSGGTLELDNPQSFRGTIAGFGLGNTIDLRSVAASNPSLSIGYHADTGLSTISISDGVHSASLSLAGQLDPGNLLVAADSFGGTTLRLRG